MTIDYSGYSANININDNNVNNLVDGNFDNNNGPISSLSINYEMSQFQTEHQTNQYEQQQEQSQSLPAPGISTLSLSASNNQNNFPYKQIHSHCSSCIQPLRCIRKFNSTYQQRSETINNNNNNNSQLTDCDTINIKNIPNCSTFNKEIYSMILNVGFYQANYLLNYHQQYRNRKNSNINNNKSNNNGDIIIKHDLDNNNDRLIDSCPVLLCPNGCRVILHYCKLPEHFLLCQYQKVCKIGYCF